MQIQAYTKIEQAEPCSTECIPQTTFSQDFSIAEIFGIEAIKETYEKAMHWKDDYIFLTELVQQKMLVLLSEKQRVQQVIRKTFLQSSRLCLSSPQRRRVELLSQKYQLEFRTEQNYPKNFI